MTDPAAREREALELLDRWPWDQGGVVVGGYAVAAYGPPRYSHDLDLVVPIAALAFLHSWLHDLGFATTTTPDDLAQNYAGRVARWQRGALIIDLLPGAVRDREARIDIPAAWICRTPRRQRLLLLDSGSRTAIPVARPEALWALKLQAGRPRDLTDLFAIHTAPAELREVRELFRERWCDTLADKLALVGRRLADPKLYRDSLSRLGWGKPQQPRHQKAWARFLGMMERALPGEPPTE